MVASFIFLYPTYGPGPRNLNKVDNCYTKYKSLLRLLGNPIIFEHPGTIFKFIQDCLSVSILYAHRVLLIAA